MKSPEDRLIQKLDRRTDAGRLPPSTPVLPKLTKLTEAPPRPFRPSLVYEVPREVPRIHSAEPPKGPPPAPLLPPVKDRPPGSIAQKCARPSCIEMRFALPPETTAPWYHDRKCDPATPLTVGQFSDRLKGLESLLEHCQQQVAAATGEIADVWQRVEQAGIDAAEVRSNIDTKKQKDAAKKLRRVMETS